MANEHVKRTPTSTGNRKTFTFAGWFKRNTLTVTQALIGSFSDSNNRFYPHYTNTDNRIRLFGRTGGSTSINVDAAESYRDVGNWHHVVIAVDTTQEDGTDRTKIYLNGVQQRLSVTTQVDKNAELYINVAGTPMRVGMLDDGSTDLQAQLTDIFYIDGQQLTPDVFGFYKDGKGYISAGSTQATDFRPGQWVPKAPRTIKSEINRRGGFGVNGFYLPMNDSTNFGADFHTTPNSIIKLQEDLQQPKVSIASTAQAGLAYTDVLRADPYAANLVLAMPFITGGSNNGYGDYSADIKGSGSNKTVTATGSNLVVGLTSALYYDSALVDTNSTSDYLTVTGSGTDFRLDPAQEDWTVEFWINPYTRSAPRHLAVLTKGSATDNNTFDWRCYVGQNVSIDYIINFGIGGDNGNETSDTATDLPPDQWTHFALEAYDGVLTKYINGVAVGVNTNPRAQTTNHSDLHIFRGDIGAANDVGFIGGLQDLRIYSGVAKYKGGFDVVKPYAPVGFSTWRAVSDTPANNFATLNALDSGASATFTNGNLSFTYTGGTSHRLTRGTIGIGTTGKWYFEGVYGQGNAVGSSGVGIARSAYINLADSVAQANVYAYHSNGNKYVDGTGSSYGSTYTTNDIIGISFDAGTGELIGYKNGVSQGTVATGLNAGPYHPVFNSYDSSSWSVNFGQNPTFSGNVAAAGTFTDGNGKGLFKYEPPSGFLALCEDNLPTPAISDPGKYFKTVLWTGDGQQGRSITGIGFTPDLVWLKTRSATDNHKIIDAVRGASKTVYSNLTQTELIETTGLLSFDTDGFSIGSDSGNNGSGRTFAAWCWKAGAGTTSTNTDGSINSVVSVNQDAGFSIISYTGNGSSGATIGHGLDGKTPAFIIVKNREAAENWQVGHTSLGWTKRIFLDLSAAEQQPSSAWNDTAPTSSVITLGNGNLANQSSKKHIAYCWAEVEGFSKFGSYVGNGSADGPFVYCGFKPALIIIKKTESSANWVLEDSTRNPTNPAYSLLQPNTDTSEENGAVSQTSIDFLSNGFKIRGNWADNNASGSQYIFAAWAESPFTTANAK